MGKGEVVRHPVPRGKNPRYIDQGELFSLRLMQFLPINHTIAKPKESNTIADLFLPQPNPFIPTHLEVQRKETSEVARL